MVGGHVWQRGMHGRRACMAGMCVTRGHAWQGGMHGRGWGAGVAGKMTIAAGGTHPTGMHSCM